MESISSVVSGHKKGATTLKSTLTGSYWQIPENKCPANRPRRANAGALMKTKSGSRIRQAIKKEKENADESKNSSGGSKGSSPKGTPPVNNKGEAKDTKLNLKKLNLEIIINEMLVSQKTALKCVFSIPESFVPTAHEEFLEKYVDIFDEEELFELFKLIKGKSKTKRTTTSPKRRRLEQFRHSKIFTVARQRKLSIQHRLHRGSSIELKVEKSEKQVISPTVAVKKLSPPPPPLPPQPTTTMTTTTKTRPVPPLLPLVIKDDNKWDAVPRPKSSFHRKKFEDDEKTEYVKLGNSEILSNGVILKVDHVNYTCEKDVDILYDDYDFGMDIALPPPQQPTVSPENENLGKESLEEPKITIAATTTTTTIVNPKASSSSEDVEMTEVKNVTPTTTKEDEIEQSNLKSQCTLPYCVLGCVCESLKSEKGPREHCGKLKCMIECTCQQGSISWTLDDVDIRSRLRPRVSMLNWSSRLNYPEAYSQEKELLSKSNPDSSVIQTYGRMKRTIVPPKRNSDFVLHSSPGKKSRGDDGRISPFVIGNRFRANQRHYLASANENSKGNPMLGRRVGLGKITKPAIQRAVQIQRNMALRPTSQMTRSRSFDLSASVEGTGDIIPPEYMAKMIPCMEIHFRPPPSRTLPLSSESESSDDDENDQDDTEVMYTTTERFSTPLPVFVETHEDDSVVPVIISYRSCQDGL